MDFELYFRLKTHMINWLRYKNWYVPIANSYIDGFIGVLLKFGLLDLTKDSGFGFNFYS